MIDLNATQWALVTAASVFFSVMLVGEFVQNFIRWKAEQKVSDEWGVRWSLPRSKR